MKGKSSSSPKKGEIQFTDDDIDDDDDIDSNSITLTIRKEFPETWILELFDNNRFVLF